MRHNHYDIRVRPFRPLVSGLVGMALLMPASFFMLTLLARIGFGSKTLYYSIAPSFLQSPFDLFAMLRTPEAFWPKANHKMFAEGVLNSIEHAIRQSAAQLIVGCLLLSILFNGLTIVEFHLERGKWGWEIGVNYRSNWLNTAIVVQGILLLLVLVAYTLVQHIRY
jgi:cellulose synthase/poly-beta-1,6-N-acetylglucosamine synthase-like glycosyltransferase